MCQILQSVRLLLQSVSGITKCDRLLLQSATVITKWDVTRDCPKSMISDNGKKKKNLMKPICLLPTLELTGI